MSALQGILFIKLCVSGRRLFGNEVFIRLIPLIPQARANDLLNLAVVDINARAESHL